MPPGPVLCGFHEKQLTGRCYHPACLNRFQHAVPIHELNAGTCLGFGNVHASLALARSEGSNRSFAFPDYQAPLQLHAANRNAVQRLNA